MQNSPKLIKNKLIPNVSWWKDDEWVWQIYKIRFSKKVPELVAATWADGNISKSQCVSSRLMTAWSSICSKNTQKSTFFQPARGPSESSESSASSVRRPVWDLSTRHKLRLGECFLLRNQKFDYEIAFCERMLNYFLMAIFQKFETIEKIEIWSLDTISKLSCKSQN